VRRVSALPLLVLMSACSSTPAEQQAKIIQLLTVACSVDGALVPAAQPVLATLGQAGAATANADLIVHPAVVAACKAVGGTPASATPVGSPQTVDIGTTPQG
jgi:hypothetical protein